MADYKSAKEAFHADNPGSSVHYINAISVTALSAYALYATTSTARRWTSPVLDWLTVVLPLLLGVTVFSGSPLVLNCVLVCIALLFKLDNNHASKAPPKPAGRWLQESDSEDENGDMDSGEYSHTHEGNRHYSNAAARGIKLPSEVVAEEAQRRRSLELASSASSSPLTLDIAGTPRRRASPSPVTPHAAIDIAASPPASPEIQGTFARSQNRLLKEKERGRERSEREREREREHHRSGPTPKAHLPFLTVYRAHMMMMTVICILAVDFPIFPRVLGKCEDFGTSLMDVGVGSFVFSLGIVSSKSFSAKNSTPWIKTCIGALRNAAPVLILGFIRLLMVKGVEYPEHLTEYGVHWNFFFTLGLIPALCSMLMPLRRRIRWTPLAVIITLLHQLLLSGTSLQAFLLSPARPGLLGQNKEGLASVPGYLAIFMLGLSAGDHILRAASPLDEGAEENGRGKKDNTAHIERANKRRTELALELAGYAAMAWAAFGASYAFGIITSRRFANLPYVLWTVAYNASYLTGYLALELFLFSPADRPCPPLLDAVNKNGLVVFLVANLLTGLVNVSFQTMYAGPTKSMVILAGYTGLVCVFAWLLRGVRIKL